MSNTSKKSGGEIVRLALSLFAITLVVSLILAVFNQITAPKIEENQLKTLKSAMSEIITGADFTKIDTSSQGDDSIIVSAYKATIDGQDAGYCVEVTPNSYGGPITEIVGINNDGTVAGVKVTTTSDTPGLGTHAQDDDWISQFKGQPADGSLSVNKDGGQIQAITGATITSRAVISGVNTAAEFVAGLE